MFFVTVAKWWFDEAIARNPMPMNIDAILRSMRDLQDELEAAFDEQRAQFAYRVEQGRIVFERDLRERHRRLRVHLSTYLRGIRPMVVLTAPVIYSLIVPFVLLDLFVSVYQRICFPVYGIARVQRGEYILFDRRQLAYLNALERFNCVYCSYANGVVAYVREVAARTEQYWCPIKHARRVAGAHDRYPRFIEYGDAQIYRETLASLRDELAEGDTARGGYPRA